MPIGLFWFLAALAIISALGVVVQRNPMHCLLSLVVTLLTIAVLFIGMGAVVVGFLQAIVYAGAIMILFLFVIWLLNLPVETGPTGHLGLKLLGSLGAAALVAELMVFALPAHLQVKFAGIPAGLRLHRRACRQAVHRLPGRLRGHLDAAAGRRDRRGGACPARAHGRFRSGAGRHRKPARRAREAS